MEDDFKISITSPRRDVSEDLLKWQNRISQQPPVPMTKRQVAAAVRGGSDHYPEEVVFVPKSVEGDNHSYTVIFALQPAKAARAARAS